MGNPEVEPDLLSWLDDPKYGGKGRQEPDLLEPPTSKPNEQPEPDLLDAIIEQHRQPTQPKKPEPKKRKRPQIQVSPASAPPDYPEADLLDIIIPESGIIRKPKDPPGKPQPENVSPERQEEDERQRQRGLRRLLSQLYGPPQPHKPESNAAPLSEKRPITIERFLEGYPHHAGRPQLPPGVTAERIEKTWGYYAGDIPWQRVGQKTILQAADIWALVYYAHQEDVNRGTNRLAQLEQTIAHAWAEPRYHRFLDYDEKDRERFMRRAFMLGFQNRNGTLGAIPAARRGELINPIPNPAWGVATNSFSGNLSTDYKPTNIFHTLWQKEWARRQKNKSFFRPQPVKPTWFDIRQRARQSAPDAILLNNQYILHKLLRWREGSASLSKYQGERLRHGYRLQDYPFKDAHYGTPGLNHGKKGRLCHHPHVALTALGIHTIELRPKKGYLDTNGTRYNWFRTRVRFVQFNKNGIVGASYNPRHHTPLSMSEQVSTFFLNSLFDWEVEIGEDNMDNVAIVIDLRNNTVTRNIDQQPDIFV